MQCQQQKYALRFLYYRKFSDMVPSLVNLIYRCDDFENNLIILYCLRYINSSTLKLIRVLHKIGE